MTYATLDQLTDRFGEQMLIGLSDRDDPPSGELVESVVASALADTDAVIDGYLARRYQLPLAETPAVVRDIALSIAIYKLHRFTPDDKIKDDYLQALKDLAAIRKGDILLPVAGVEPEAKDGSGVRTNDRERPFTEKGLRGFV